MAMIEGTDDYKTGTARLPGIRPQMIRQKRFPANAVVCLSDRELSTIGWLAVVLG
jgi:hypothetical protein